VGGLVLISGIGIGGYLAYDWIKKRQACLEEELDTYKTMTVDAEQKCMKCSKDILGYAWQEEKDATLCGGGNGDGLDCTAYYCIPDGCGTDADPLGGGPDYFYGGAPDPYDNCKCKWPNVIRKSPACVPRPSDLRIIIDRDDITNGTKLVQTPGWNNCFSYAPWFGGCALFPSLCPESPAKYPAALVKTVQVQVQDQWARPYKAQSLPVVLDLYSDPSVMGFRVPGGNNGYTIYCLPIGAYTDQNGIASFDIIQTFDPGTGRNVDVLMNATCEFNSLSAAAQLSLVGIGCGYPAKDILGIPDALHTCQYYMYSRSGC